MHLIIKLLKAKWRLLPPKPKKIIIFDGIQNPFSKYFDESDYNIIYRRGEEINIFVLIKCLLELNLKPLNYFLNFIKISRPKIILTAIDYNPTFYLLSKATGVKTAFVQFGTRTKWNDLFANKKITNKHNKDLFYVDYMFTFNKFISNLYQSFISGKTIEIGSFKNNFNRRKRIKKKEILFISTFKSFALNNKKFFGFSNKFFFKNDSTVIKKIFLLAKNKKIKFNILGRGIGNEGIKEENYFNYILGKKNFSFIENYLGRKTYDIVNNYKYIFTIDSTLGIENLALGNNTGFLFNRPYKFPINTRRFGGMEGLPRKGPFWTTYNLASEFKRVFNYIIRKTNYSNWRQKEKNIAKKVMVHDYNNKKFINIVNKILKDK
jgi:surface carbohydrate biosynthesis protein